MLFLLAFTKIRLTTTEQTLCKTWLITVLYGTPDVATKRNRGCPVTKQNLWRRHIEKISTTRWQYIYIVEELVIQCLNAVKIIFHRYGALCFHVSTTSIGNYCLRIKWKKIFFS